MLNLKKTRKIEDFEIIQNPTSIVIYSDDQTHKSYAGSAHFRKYKNSYGFITHKAIDSFFTTKEYEKVYQVEISKLYAYIAARQSFRFLIPPIGSKRANKHKIFEQIINKKIKKDLQDLKNIEFLW